MFFKHCQMQHSSVLPSISDIWTCSFCIETKLMPVLEMTRFISSIIQSVRMIDRKCYNKIPEIASNVLQICVSKYFFNRSSKSNFITLLIDSLFLLKAV